MNKAKLIEMIGDIQEQRPGWRFSLLGGDTTFGYVDDSPKKGVDPASKKTFGWKAEFFGHEDPRKSTGERKATAHCLDLDNAILLACARATRAIRDGIE